MIITLKVVVTYFTDKNYNKWCYYYKDNIMLCCDYNDKNILCCDNNDINILFCDNNDSNILSCNNYNNNILCCYHTLLFVMLSLLCYTWLKNKWNLKCCSRFCPGLLC